MGLGAFLDGKDVPLSIAFLVIGIVFPPLWILNGIWLLSEEKLAKLVSFIALILWSILTLGTVLAIMFYVMVIVPLFNLVPQAKDDYVANYGPLSNVTAISLF